MIENGWTGMSVAAVDVFLTDDASEYA